MILAKKSLGQNYLIDKNIIKKILSLTELRNQNIIEIGPGQGALTEEIIKLKPKSFSIIEKDNLLAENLKNKFANIKNVKVYNNDILNFNLEKICKMNTTIIGNLPYNISSQILVKIIKFKKWPPKFSNLVLMFQKELGEKIIGKYPSSKYGRLSIITNLRLNFIKKFLVSSNCFFPKPKVTSMVIHFKTKKKYHNNIKRISNLEKITGIFFSNKRKMINKSLKKILSEDKIKKIHNLNINSRPADLKPEIYYKITELYEG
tara:strand:+ start:9319 stop:10101 length:783 start_codon:yes stop_codon:yes gene_type:complete